TMPGDDRGSDRADLRDLRGTEQKAAIPGELHGKANLRNGFSMREALRCAKLGNQVIVAGVILMVMRVDYGRDCAIGAESYWAFLELTTAHGKHSMEHRRATDEIAARVVVTAAESTQEPGEQVVDSNAGDMFDRMSDRGVERPQWKATAHHRERLPQ